MYQCHAVLKDLAAHLQGFSRRPYCPFTGCCTLVCGPLQPPLYTQKLCSPRATAELVAYSFYFLACTTVSV